MKTFASLLLAVLNGIAAPAYASTAGADVDCRVISVCDINVDIVQPFDVDIVPFKGKGPRGLAGKGIKSGKKISAPPGKKPSAAARPNRRPGALPPGKKGGAGASSKLWGKGNKTNSLANANHHWHKHRKAFPEHKSAAQYAKAAVGFVRAPPKGTSIVRRRNGETMYYHRKSNTFAVKSRQGQVSTMFRPKDGQKYWRRQLELWR